MSDDPALIIWGKVISQKQGWFTIKVDCCTDKNNNVTTLPWKNFKGRHYGNTRFGPGYYKAKKDNYSYDFQIITEEVIVPQEVQQRLSTIECE